MSRLSLLAATLALLPISAPALAEPGDTVTSSGTVAAEIVEPGRVIKIDDLRFGAFASPTARATMTVSPDGTATATGEVATTMNAFTSADGRGPALFRIDGTDSRMFLVFHPRNMTISNGTSTMRVDRMEDNVIGPVRLDLDGRFDYRVGGRLNIDANQEAGDYSGEFEITVLFL